MEFGLPLLYPLEKNGSLIHKTPLTQELSCVRGIQRRKNVIEHWTVIRENCREEVTLELTLVRSLDLWQQTDVEGILGEETSQMEMRCLSHSSNTY